GRGEGARAPPGRAPRPAPPAGDGRGGAGGGPPPAPPPPQRRRSRRDAWPPSPDGSRARRRPAPRPPAPGRGPRPTAGRCGSTLRRGRRPAPPAARRPRRAVGRCGPEACGPLASRTGRPLPRLRTARPGRIALSSVLYLEVWQHLGGESLELGELVVADEPDAQIAHAGRGVAGERGDHRVGGTKPHRSARVDAAAVVRRQELRGDALGGARIVVDADGRVDAELEGRLRAAVTGQGFLGALADEPALLGVDVRGDDPVAEPAEAVELGGEHLAAVGRGDEDRRPGRIPRQGTDRVIAELHVAALV